MFLEERFSDYNTSYSYINSLDDEYMKLEIPSISLYRKVYDIGNIKNNIDLNIELLYKDNMLVLVSHSGNADNAYFKNLKKLEVGNEVYIYYDDQKEIYIVNRIYCLAKQDEFGLKESFRNKLILITCLNKNEYLIIECQRQNT